MRCAAFPQIDFDGVMPPAAALGHRYEVDAEAPQNTFGRKDLCGAEAEVLDLEPIVPRRPENGSRETPGCYCRLEPGRGSR